MTRRISIPEELKPLPIGMLDAGTRALNGLARLALPWVSFDSDAGSLATEGVFLESNPHPRAYGNFARLLGKYVREENVISLEEAIRRLTSLPAENLKLRRRGSLTPGAFADVVVFDPSSIIDHATFEQPHQYATGVVHVFVNGVQVLRAGEHTGALPGRVVRGPGWTGWYAGTGRHGGLFVATTDSTTDLKYLRKATTGACREAAVPRFRACSSANRVTLRTTRRSRQRSGCAKSTRTAQAHHSREKRSPATPGLRRTRTRFGVQGNRNVPGTSFARAGHG